MKPIVTIRRYMLTSLYAFESEVRRQMRMLGMISEANQFSYRATLDDGSPIQEALRYVEISLRE